MRRYLVATLLVVVLAVIAFSQRINANPQGGMQNYSPLVFGAAPTPTASPTVEPTATATATPGAPVGTGFFKKNGSTFYDAQENEYIGACGFIHFFDGTPAYGGSNGFRAEACMDGRACATSGGVDATGYYEIPIAAFEDMPDEGGGSIHVIFGEDDEQVSQNYRWDFEDVNPAAVGVVIRMDFIECRADDPSARCQETLAEGYNGYAVTDPIEGMSPQYACPTQNDPTPTPD